MEKTGYVYKLCCRDPTVKDVYIGSTKNLRVRKAMHKHKCNSADSKEYNFRVYQFIRANGGFDNWDVIQLEEIDYNTRAELHARERHFFELLNATLNKCVPNRTPAESVKNYFVNHRDEINEKQKIKNNCVCGGKYTHINRSHHFASNKHLLYMANQQQLKLLAGAEPIGNNTA